MKAASFDYVRPSGVEEACRLLAEFDGRAKVLAGGQSLGPMLNLRLVRPDVVVDVTALSELKGVEDGRDNVLIGACVTTANVEDGRVPDPAGGALADVARHIAYRAVRNRGTVGGSLVHADPSADWVSCLAAFGATARVAGPNGRRQVPIERFVTAPFEVDLGPGELLVAVRVPRLGPGARFGFYKFCRRTGEFAEAIGVVLCDPARGVFRAAIGATESTPIVVADAASLFGGRRDGPLAPVFDAGAVAARLTEAGIVDPYRRRVLSAALRRAASRADAS